MIRLGKGSQIDEAAAVWSIRFERGLTAQEAEALEEWLTRDVRHAGAYARVRAVTAATLPLAGAVAPAGGAHRDDLRQSSAVSRRAAIAAGLAMAVGGVGAGAMVWRREQSYRTGRGEVRDYVLADGTRMTLSAFSSVSVRMNGARRDVVMTEGEALLEVARSDRPLRILAAGAEVVAPSGRVLMRRYAQDPLQVAPLDADLSISTPQTTLHIAAGEGVAVGRRTVRRALDEDDIQRALAWREGQVALHDDPLAEAARAFARFSEVRVEFDSDDTALLKITGLFNLHDPVGFARAAALSLNLTVALGDGIVRLMSRN